MVCGSESQTRISAAFCDLYCSPLCCVSEANIVKQCNSKFEDSYVHMSSSLRSLKLYWRGANDDSVGVYARENMGLKMENGGLSLANYKFALNTVISLNFLVPKDPKYIFNRIGLRRRADGSSFVADLYNNGLIAQPLLSICRTQRLRGFSRLNFGKLCTDACEDYHFFDIVSGMEFMLDVAYAKVFDYEIYGRHRMVISESEAFYVPQVVLAHLLNTKILRFYNQQKYMVEINPEYKFLWKLSDTFDISLNATTMFSRLPSQAFIIIKSLEPNPDDLKWILSSRLFFQYCVALDYEKTRIGFARMQPRKDLRSDG
ncbi:unnamed protein product [Bursaphelenchus xylophilus]|uniref:(pine wood nematode) hypothetical protein n=1 Tax=Bursaphelenchus xylophilus TaxID=6326 RepID=A0A1I7S868_BURXY|nr:unnamed protein product [Bursaphelenchus xylophilus]CAG9080511.1 unnamed protein product [Bursaphelenchus xylophilus]